MTNMPISDRAATSWNNPTLSDNPIQKQ